MNNLLNIARAAAFAALCSGCVVWSAAALAADDNVAPQGTLVVSGADFASPRAVAHLKRHLRYVADNICTAQSGGELMRDRSEQACYQTAIKDGITQIDARREQALRERTVRLADANSGNTLAQ